MHSVFQIRIHMLLCPIHVLCLLASFIFPHLFLTLSSLPQKTIPFSLEVVREAVVQQQAISELGFSDHLFLHVMQIK